EARSVHDREILVAERLADGERHFQITRYNGLDNRHAATKPLPEALGGSPSQSVPKEDPRLHQDVIRRQQALASRQHPAAPLVAPIPGVGRRIPEGRVDEERHRPPRCGRRVAATASPMYRSSRLAMSDPPESPRLNTTVGSAAGSGRATSWATSLRTYSAREMPSSLARPFASLCVRGSRPIWVRTIMMLTS